MSSIMHRFVNFLTFRLKMFRFNFFCFIIFHLYLSDNTLLVLAEEFNDIDSNDSPERTLEGLPRTVDGIFPILNGMICFRANETSEFRSSSGEQITCHCGKATRSELPVIREYKVWSCVRNSHRITPPPKRRPTRTPRPRPIASITKAPHYTVRPTTPKKSNGNQPGGSLPFPDAPTKLPEKLPAFGSPQIGGSKPNGNEPPAGAGQQKPLPDQGLLNPMPQDPGCNYCVLSAGQSSYQCVRAFSYECVGEIQRLQYFNVPVQCADDYWTYNQRTHICQAEENYNKIYMVIGTPST